MKNSLTLVALTLLATQSLACGSKSSTSGFTAPGLQAIVNNSLPAGLKPGAKSPTALVDLPSADVSYAADSAATLSTLAAKSIQNFFQDTYVGPNGAQVQGFLAAQVANVDGRLSGISQLSMTGKCTSSTPASFTADFSSTIDAVAKITLPNLQCSSSFSGASDGSGEVFGSSGSNYSLWVPLGAMGSTGFTAGGGFLSYANVANAGSTTASAPESVDGMLIAYQPGIYTGFVARFKANSTLHTFELYYGGNGSDIKGVGTSDQSVYLGAGFRMISDGTHIYADGLVYNPANSSAGWQSFTTCMDPTTLAVDATASDCSTLSTGFTLGTASAGATLNYCEIVGAGANCTIPGPTAQSSQVQMASAAVTAIGAKFPITAAPSSVTAY